MTKYDYLNGNKTTLSHNGKNPDIRLIKGFNFKRVLIEAGNKNFLKGEAQTDYLNLMKGGEGK